MLSLTACSAPDDSGAASSDTEAAQSDSASLVSDSGSTSTHDPSHGPGGTTGANSGETGGDASSASGGTDDCGEGCTGGMPNQACDVIDQNCPEGEKCTPYASDDGLYWDATKCVPVWPEPVGPGEPCMTFEGPTTGVDNCDANSMCYGVDPETFEGVCAEFCFGDAYPFECSDPRAQCHWANDGVLAVCVRACNPMKQDCKDGQGCYPGHDEFECDFDNSNAPDAVGATCTQHTQCPRGMFCAPGKFIPACDGEKCCAEYCDPGADENACWGANEGVECIPLAELPEGPSPTDDVGVCIEPP